MIVGVWLVYNSAATLPASAASVWPFIDAALFIDGDFDGHERSDDGTPGIVEEFSRGDSRLLQRLVPEKRRKSVAYLTWSGPYPCKKRNVYLEHELVREASWVWQVDSDEVWTEEGARWARRAAIDAASQCHTISTRPLAFTHSFAYYHWPTSQGNGPRLYRAQCMAPWDHQPGAHERLNWKCTCNQQDLVCPEPFFHYQLFQTREQAIAKLRRHRGYDGVSIDSRAALANDFFRPLEDLVLERRLVPFGGRHPRPMVELHRQRIESDMATARECQALMGPREVVISP